MANRSVKVSLVLAAQGYMQGMGEVARQTSETGSKIEKLGQQREAFNQLGSAALGFGAAVGVGVGMAVSSFMDFDQQMSNVQAATHETAANMDLLRDAAIDAGARTVYSATEAAGAIEELSKAGIATADILGGGLDGALDLAAAGGIAVADAAEIAASAMTQFGLAGNDVSHVADLLSAGAGKAQGGVEEMCAALNQSGLVAAQMGLSIEATVGSLTMFASAGLMGSDAGTSFRSALLMLANPTKESAKLMEELGLDFYDAQGQFIGMEGVAGQLETRLQGLTQEQRNAALAQIFGMDAIRAASILYEGGAESVQEWTAAVDDAGYAQETAATRLDNLKGDWEALTGSIDSAMITMGEGANGPLREIVQGLSEFVDRFNAMPDEVQQGTLLLGGIAGALSLAAGGFMVAIPQIADFNKALNTMGTGAQRAGRAAAWMGRAGLFAGGLVAVGAGANYLATQLGMVGDGAKSVEATLKALLDQDYDGAFAGISSEVTDLASGLELLLGNSFNSQAERFGSQLNVFGWADQVSETREQFAAVGDSLAQLVNGGDAERAAEMFDQIAAAAKEQGFSVEEVLSLMPGYQDALDGASNAAELAAGSSQETAGAIDSVADSAEEAQKKVDELADTIRGFGSAELNVRDAHREFEAAVDALSDAIENNERTLDRSTETGRANEQSLDDLAISTLELAASTFELTKNEDDAARVIRDGRQVLLDKLEAFGITGEAAQQYADKLGLVPEAVNTNVQLQGVSEAETALEWLARTRESRIVVWAEDGESGRMGNRFITTNATGNLYENGKPKEFAGGGFASGIYPYTPGGIHKFAEEHDEAYISLDPARQDRSLDIWQETGRRLGAWQPSPDYVLAGAQPAAGKRESVTYAPVINQRPGVSDRRIAQVAQEEFAFELGG